MSLEKGGIFGQIRYCRRVSHMSFSETAFYVSRRRRRDRGMAADRGQRDNVTTCDPMALYICLPHGKKISRFRPPRIRLLVLWFVTAFDDLMARFMLTWKYEFVLANPLEPGQCSTWRGGLPVMKKLGSLLNSTCLVPLASFLARHSLRLRIISCRKGG